MRKSKDNATQSYCLGIESTADDFSVGISTFQGEILANVIDAYIPIEGGIHPREAARHHAEVTSRVLEEAFMKSTIKPQNLSVIAFSQGPGLGPCLRTGATVARVPGHARQADPGAGHGAHRGSRRVFTRDERLSGGVSGPLPAHALGGGRPGALRIV